jgi:hypothetical protein
MNYKKVIEVCIPHRLPPRVQVFGSIDDYGDYIMEEARKSDVHNYEKITWDDALSTYETEEEMPEALLEILREHGEAIGINGSFESPEDAPLESDWAFKVVNGDYSSAYVLSFDEAKKYCEPNGRWKREHQGNSVRWRLLQLLEDYEEEIADDEV